MTTNREQEIAYRVVRNQLRKLKNFDANEIVVQVWKDANQDVTEPLDDVLKRVTPVAWQVDALVDSLLETLKARQDFEGL